MKSNKSKGARVLDRSKTYFILISLILGLCYFIQQSDSIGQLLATLTIFFRFRTTSAKPQKLNLKKEDVPIELNRINQLKKTCTICKQWKPPKSHHCNICGRCYFMMDHHCVLLDTCIAYHNLKYFLQFLIAVSISIVYILYELIFSQKYLYEKQRMVMDSIRFENLLSSTVPLTVWIIIIQQCAMALGQTYELLQDKVQQVLKLQSYIDQVQNKVPYTRESYQNYRKQLGPWYTFIFPWNNYELSYLECRYEVNQDQFPEDRFFREKQFKQFKVE